jgi:hypothetical protein
MLVMLLLELDQLPWYLLCSSQVACDAWLTTSPLGTPRGRCDEYSSKIFPQLRNKGFIDQEKSGQYN